MKSKIVSVLVVLFFIAMTPINGSGQIHKQIIKVEKKGKQGYLGVEMQDVTKKLKEKKNLSVDRGAYIQSVVEDSPAEEAGIQKGDVIVKFGEEVIDGSEDLTDAVHTAKPKTEVKVEINRKGEKKTLTAVVGKAKSPQAFTFNFNDDGMQSFSNKMKMPKLSRSLNLRVCTESALNGMQVQPLTKQLGEYFGAPKGKGVLITEVEKGSGAEKAGFRAGDVITKIEDRTIDDIEELHEKISDYDGKEIPFEVIRSGKTLKLSMTVEEEKGDDEDEDDWSNNLFIAPGNHCMKTFRFDVSPHHLELDRLREKLFNLREGIQRGVKNIKRTIQRELIES